MPAPTPTPREAAYLPGFGNPDVHFDDANPLVLDVGQTVTLRMSSFTFHHGDQVPAYTWGVLEGDRARIDAQGNLTVTAPGTLHVYAESEGQRRYCAIAAVAVPRVWDTLPFTTNPAYTDHLPHYATYLQSAEDWKRFWAPFTIPESIPPAPAVDFSKSTVLAVTAVLASGGEARDMILTHIDDGEAPTYHVSLTNLNTGQEMSSQAVVVERRFFVLPKRSGPATLELNFAFQPAKTLPVSATVEAPPADW